MRWVLSLIVLGACAFEPRGAADDGGDDRDDAGGGGDGAGPDACVGASWLDTCALPPPAGALILDGPGTYTYDTDSGELHDAQDERVDHTSVVVAGGEGDVRVIVASAVTIGAGAELRATGDLPLAIHAHGDLIVDGAIDVGRGGAGRRSAASCAGSAGGTGGDNSGGAAGGGGGGFGAAGAGGGNGNSDGTASIGGGGGI